MGGIQFLGGISAHEQMFDTFIDAATQVWFVHLLRRAVVRIINCIIFKLGFNWLTGHFPLQQVTSRVFWGESRVPLSVTYVWGRCHIGKLLTVADIVMRTVFVPGLINVWCRRSFYVCMCTWKNPQNSWWRCIWCHRMTEVKLACVYCWWFWDSLEKSCTQ